MIYIATALITYMSYYLSYKKGMKFQIGQNNIKKSNIYVVSIIFLIVLAGFRASSVGFDTYYYKKNIDLLSSGNINEGYNYEFLFQLICFTSIKIFSNTNIAFCFTLLCCESIIVLCVHYTAKSLSKDVSLSMFLFASMIYLRGFDQLRQCVAISLLMVACVYLLRNNYCGFLSMCIFAYMFHKTALLFVPICLLYLLNKKNKYLNYCIITILAIVFCCFESSIVNIVSKIVGKDYFTQLGGWESRPFTIIGILELILNILILLFFIGYEIYAKYKNRKLNQNYFIYSTLFFCSIVFFTMSVILGKQLQYERIAYYFYWVLIFLVPEFLMTIHNKKLKKVFEIIMFSCGLGYLLVSLAINANGCVPFMMNSF